jgi:hypothetical protein
MSRAKTLMQKWIDVLNKNGQKLGDDPLDQVLGPFERAGYPFIVKHVARSMGLSYTVKYSRPAQEWARYLDAVLSAEIDKRVASWPTATRNTVGGVFKAAVHAVLGSFWTAAAPGGVVEEIVGRLGPVARPFLGTIRGTIEAVWDLRDAFVEQAAMAISYGLEIQKLSGHKSGSLNEAFSSHLLFWQAVMFEQFNPATKGLFAGQKARMVELSWKYEWHIWDVFHGHKDRARQILNAWPERYSTTNYRWQRAADEPNHEPHSARLDFLILNQLVEKF